ncbi:hypothetical protein QJS10_CPA08g01327 [Acorus calamus]|uniref:Uncharacterized protein n=1 Tax=Acorus calamus TaxID=4465 RepID=A0AAV9EBL5_ACOCL|nr:hypothetical protein QJS10_CPA08g01327 [Acorus calamus]
MASHEPEEDFIPFSQFPASQDFGPDSSQSHSQPSIHPMLQVFGFKKSKTKEGSFNITTNSSSSNYYSDQPLLIPILNNWEKRIHRNQMVYVDRIHVSIDPLVPLPAAQLSPDASVLVCVMELTFGLMIGMNGVQGVRVSWKLSYQVHSAKPPYMTNGTYEQKEGDGGGEGKMRHHQNRRMDKKA